MPRLGLVVLSTSDELPKTRLQGNHVEALPEEEHISVNVLLEESGCISARGVFGSDVRFGRARTLDFYRITIIAKFKVIKKYLKEITVAMLEDSDARFE